MDDRGSRALALLLNKAYEGGLDDYHMGPLCPDRTIGRIKDKDSVVFCCRRGEREIELTEFFTTKTTMKDLFFVLLTQYHECFRNLPIAFKPQEVPIPMGEVVSNNSKSQLHIAESEKFAHVTFFYNGGRNEAFKGETDICIPSPKGIGFDQVPRLSLDQVSDKLISALGSYDFIVANFANGDVIGHTANKEAKLKACEAVSQNLQKVTQEALKQDYVVIVTADHGNIEKLYNENHEADVAHTTNPVAMFVLDNNRTSIKLHDGKLADVGPTILEIMGLDKPSEMTGKSLLEKGTWKKGQKALLLILDGWGLGTEDQEDAIFLSNTPYWDSLISSKPYAKLHASGSYVGLGEGKSGNSEAGHMNLGAGRVVIQDDIRIDKCLEDGSFYENEELLEAVLRAKANSASLHLLTYLTYKSSHGSMEYALGVCRMAKAHDLEQVYLHIIFDGRSTEPHSAPELLQELEDKLNEIGVGLIVDGIGRAYALDRDRNYDKVQLAYSLMTGK